ncbi:MAG: hypothetical protein D6702_01210 [Planctomycetota bacterium]|nr:MAG: hypothetical protein D6702_01210 [Planctomycetota bacterium]
MKETLAALVAAQRLDERLLVLRRRRASLPAELSEREAGHAVLEAEREEAEVRRKAALVRARELENEVRGLEERLARLEAKSRTLRDAGAVQVAQHEAQEIRDAISRAQDEELQLLEDADRLAGETTELAARIEQSAGELAAFRSRVETDAAELDAEIAELEGRRDARLGAVPNQVAETYRTLLDKRQGRAVAPLKGRSCGGCGMAVPPNDQLGVINAAKLVRCRSCQRFLVPLEVWSPESSAAEGSSPPPQRS